MLPAGMELAVWKALGGPKMSGHVQKLYRTSAKKQLFSIEISKADLTHEYSDSN
jgi:hypothetical protein